MCGIAGFSRRPRTSIPNGKRFAIALAIAIESRGRHATGFGWAEGDDHENVWYAKRKGPAGRVASQLPLPNAGIHTLMAHTRHATLGDPKLYDNNHPVVNGHIVAVHNGRIANHRELVEMTDVQRAGTVDSFAIPALLSTADQLSADHPVELLELIEGVAAVSWMDANEPELLHLARLSTRPLHYGWTKRGDFVYASTRTALERASASAQVTVQDISSVAEGTYLCVHQGEVVDYRDDFQVNHPPQVIVEDVPELRGYTLPPKRTGPKRKGNKPASLADIAEAEAEKDLSNFVANMNTDFESWESAIDWDHLVSRRGWMNDDHEETPF